MHRSLGQLDEIDDVPVTVAMMKQIRKEAEREAKEATESRGGGDGGEALEKLRRLVSPPPMAERALPCERAMPCEPSPFLWCALPMTFALSSLATLLSLCALSPCARAPDFVASRADESDSNVT